MEIQDVVDMLLDLRHQVAVDKSCYESELAHMVLSDVMLQIDAKLKEITE